MDEAKVSDASPQSQEFVADSGASVSAAVPALTRGQRLARLAAVHLLLWIISLSLFAAADSWVEVSGLGLANLLAVLTGALAGITTTTLVHEWFHYFGARRAKGRYDIPPGIGLFVYDWDFGSNNTQQFMTMSVAGSVGGALAVIMLWWSLPGDTLGRAAVHGGALAGFVFAACVEWPVLRRTRVSSDPLAELSKINEGVLTRSFVVASIAGILVTLLI